MKQIKLIDIEVLSRPAFIEVRKRLVDTMGEEAANALLREAWEKHGAVFEGFIEMLEKNYSEE